MIQLLLTEIELNGIKLTGRTRGTELGLSRAAEKLPCIWKIAVVSHAGLGTGVVFYHAL